MGKKRTTIQKLYRFIGLPILTFVILYFVRLIFTGGHPDWWEILGAAIGLTIAYWIELLYPPKPPEDPEKKQTSLKEDIKRYTIDGSPFNRVVVIVYALCFLSIIGVFVMMAITGD